MKISKSLVKSFLGGVVSFGILVNAAHASPLRKPVAHESADREPAASTRTSTTTSSTTTTTTQKNYPVPQYTTPAYSQPTRSSLSRSEEQPFFGGFEVGAQYPSVMGLMGQGFKGGIGFHSAFNFNVLGDLRTALYVGYQNMPLRVDATTSFRVIPILAQIGFEGKTTFDWLYTSFDLGIGGALGWLNIPGATDFSPSGYFAAQIQPGFEVVITDAVSFVFHMPVLYLFGKRTMGYLAYDGGVKINL